MVRTFAHGKVAASFAAAALGITIALAAGVSQAETQRENRLAAAAEVQEALQREIYGLAAERESLLLAAARRAPQYAPALWHLGHVKDARNHWLSADDFIEQWISSRKIKLYEAARQQAADSVEGQLALAEHCRRDGLADQMRAALTRVLEIDSNHEAARAALGFVRMGPLWLSRAEMEAEEALARAQDESVSRWRSDLEELAKGFVSDSLSRRAAATEKLLSLHDTAAIAAMERIVSPVSDEAALAVIGALSQCREPDASLSLARHAVLYPSLRVREAAADALARRDLHGYVPALVQMMVTPVESRVAAGALPGGRIGFRQVFLRDTIDRQDVLILDTEYERISQPGGSRAGAARLAAADARDSAVRRVVGAERQNEVSLRLNERIAWVLNRATQQDLPASPETWWKWWNDQNERLPGDQKTLAVSQVYRRVQISDPVPQIGIGSGIQTGGGGGECLVAGTLVWTASGPTAVEKVQRRPGAVPECGQRRAQLQAGPADDDAAARQDCEVHRRAGNVRVQRRTRLLGGWRGMAEGQPTGIRHAPAHGPRADADHVRRNRQRRGDVQPRRRRFCDVLRGPAENPVPRLHAAQGHERRRAGAQATVTTNTATREPQLARIYAGEGNASAFIRGSCPFRRFCGWQPRRVPPA
jgi:hypothetical protein